MKMPNKNSCVQPRLSGRFAKIKQINHFRKRSEVGRMNKERLSVSENGRKNDTDLVDAKEAEGFPIKGHRILDLEYFAEKFYCKTCKKPLLIQNIAKRDSQQGLGSTFFVRCDECSCITGVDSSKKYSPPGNHHKVFEINSKVAIGT